MKKSCNNCKYGQTDDLWTPCCAEESPSCEYPELKLWEPIEEDNKCYDCVNIMQCSQETMERCKDQNYNFFKQKVIKNKDCKSCDTCKHFKLPICELSGLGIRSLGTAESCKDYCKIINNISEKNDYITKKEKNTYHEVAKEVADIVEEKNKAYGNAAGECNLFLELLYPDGVNVKDYKNMLFLVRLWDKIKRIATDKDAFGEEPEKDIIGYCLQKLNNKEN